MNDVIINVNEKTGVAYKKICNQKLGNQYQNLQNKLKFEFLDIDNIPKGIAWLEYENDGNKNYALMEEYEKGYQIDIKSCLLIGDHVEVDLKITQEENPNGIPVFVSSIVKFEVERTINAEEEEPEQYPSWFDSANKVLKETSNLDLDVSKVGNISTITITKKDGTQKSVEVYDGTDETGNNGATFTPSVSEEGIISWINDKGLVNPTPINIKGPQGADGKDGEPGEKGEPFTYEDFTAEQLAGLVGPKGDKGEPGTDGVNGIDGKDGLNGTNGVDGKDGITPTIGENGNWFFGDTDTGNPSRGEPGTNGTNGIDGQSATITIGTVTTLDAGSNATVENVGTSIDAIFNFGIPKGQAGENAVDSITSTSINSIQVVDTLPETEVEGVLYLVKETPTEPTNLWVNPTVLTGHYISSTSGEIGTQEIGYTAYISCEPNTTYKITRTMSGYRFTIASYSSVPKEGSTTTNVTNASDLSEVTFTTGASDNYLAIYYFGGSETLDATELLNDIVVTKVENLYNYLTAPILNNAKVKDNTIVAGTNQNTITYLKIEANTTYTISKTVNEHFGVGLSTEEPVVGTAFNSYSNDATLSSVTITTGANDNYLAIYYWTSYDTGTEEEIRSSIVVTKVS